MKPAPPAAAPSAVPGTTAQRPLPRVAIAQLNPYPGDLEGNVAKILAWIAEAKAKGADIILFPETAVTAYSIGDKHKRRSFVEENRRLVHDVIAPAAKGIVVVLGFIDFDTGRRMKDGLFARYNAYAVCAEGRVVATGRKTLLIDDGVLDDSRHYVAGRPEDIGPVTVTIGGKPLTLGLLVCQDLWDDDEPVKPARLLADAGAELLLVLNSSPFYVGKLPVRLEIARRRVAETGLPLVYCNTVGAQDNGKNIILFDGGSFALDATGALVSLLPQFEETLTTLPATTLSAAPKDGRMAAEPPTDRIAELHAALLFGITDFYKKSGVFNGVVIGLSGGIDSAVDAALLAEALGPERVLCVNMPSRFNSETTKGAAAALAKNLGCELLIHPIQAVVERKVADLVAVTGAAPKTLTLENMQARERGNILMEHSQERGFMVVGNGNKTEFQRGYATLYGDIIGALMPLGDVNKLDVYALGRLINRRAGKELIPQAIFDIVPSAELSDKQDVDKGEGDPFDYSIESPLGVELVENLRSPEELVALFRGRRLDPALWIPGPDGRSVYDKLSAEEFGRMAAGTFAAIKGSYFKRVQAPPIIIVSRRAFGFDFRETLFNRAWR